MEQLSSEHGVGTASTAERAVLDWHMANLECVGVGTALVACKLVT
jgi:hypothetical protein